MLYFFVEIYNLTDLECFPKRNFSWTKEKKIIEVVSKLNGPWRFVGGCVRDSLLGDLTYDIDITTTLKPDEVEKMVEEFSISCIGKKFGTIGVFCDPWQIEITTTREDIKTYGRMADVKFLDSFEEDSKRRDFTINSLMLDADGNIYDFQNGIKDLEKNKIVFIGDAEKRIKEDYLRIVRYFRFVVKFNDNPSYKVEIYNNLKGLEKVSIERVISELEKASKNKNFNQMIFLMNLYKVSEEIFKIDLEIPMDLIDNSYEAKMAQCLRFTDFRNLPIPKNIRELIEIFNINIKNKNKYEIIDIAAQIWQKNKNARLAKKFLEYCLSINGERYLVYLIKIEWKNPKVFNIMDFEPRDRSKMEKIEKINFLIKIVDSNK